MNYHAIDENPDLSKRSLKERVQSAMIKDYRGDNFLRNIPGLNGLNAKIISCPECDFLNDRKRPVLPEGPAHARIMFIGQAPNINAEIHNRPFPTRLTFDIPETGSGSILARWLGELDLPREWVYLTNLVKCKPKKERKEWINKEKQIGNCKGYLKEEIELIKPRLIVTLGVDASREFFPKERFGYSSNHCMRMEEMHGQRWEEDNMTYFAMYHPAALLRGAVDCYVIKEDLSSLRGILDEIFECTGEEEL